MSEPAVKVWALNAEAHSQWSRDSSIPYQCHEEHVMAFLQAKNVLHVFTFCMKCEKHSVKYLL